MFILEEFDEVREHEYYEQPYPVEHETRLQGPSGTTTGKVSLFTACKWKQEEPMPVPILVPTPSVPTMNLTGQVVPMKVMVTVPRTITGNPRVDPIVTKPGLFGSDGDTENDSDHPLLFGPEFDLVVSHDVTGWSWTHWLPESTSLHLYARVLFGSFEVFDVPSAMQLYSVGARLGIPFLKVDSFNLGAVVSAGPAFLRTDIGDAVGFDGGVGVRAEQVLTKGLTFVASLEANLYVSSNVFAFGPALNLGFNLAW